MTIAVAIADSRNIFHQAGDATGVRALPTVPGVRAGLRRYGFDVAEVHIGLALARPADQADLARHHAENDQYRQEIIKAGGDVLLGELHRRLGRVEEKIVDCACCVRITRYVDEIAYRRTSVQVIVVLSQDIDLRPAVDYAMAMRVPIIVAATDVVQHRAHPFILLGPHAYAEITSRRDLASGHELRELLAQLLAGQAPVPWTVTGPASRPVLAHASGLTAVPGAGVTLPRAGETVALWPVDVTWDKKLMGAFPVLVCERSPRRTTAWLTAKVRRRTAPMTLEIEHPGRRFRRVQFPLGGVAPGDDVLVHGASGRVLGRVAGVGGRAFDPDVPGVLRVVSALAKGGTLAIDSAGRRGLLATDQPLAAGQRVPAVQIDMQPKGPVWAAIGTALPG
jgi:hypothetical protein